MKNKINIILKVDHPYIGKKGTIHKVSPGYAINYLIPNNLAEFATHKKIKHYNMFHNIIKKQNEEYQIEANKIKNILREIHKIKINRKQGEIYNFFGSITEKHIIGILKLYTGKVFEKRQINISNMKHIGVYDFNINITNDVKCEFKLHVIPENI